jgi:hypothetical protein
MSTSMVIMKSVSPIPKMIIVIVRVEMCEWRVTGAMVRG